MCPFGKAEKILVIVESLTNPSSNAFVFDVLGLQEVSDVGSHDEKLSETIALLISLRNQARTQKNFALSDQIRDQLVEIGIHLKDGKDGTTFYLD